MKSIGVLVSLAYCAVLSSANESHKEWSYKTNDPSVYPPAHWGLYEPACDGKRQSPIDIQPKSSCGSAAPKRTMSPLSFTGACSEATVKELEDAYKAFADNDQGCQLQLTSSGKSYSFVQSHYHAPSEHTLNGKAHDGEIHFVHSGEDGNVVVGVFLQKKEGATTDPYLLKFFETTPSVDGSNNVTASVALGSFFPAVEKSMASGRVFNYPGSLTNPPCSETVDWWVVETPLVVSPSDFEKMHKELLRLTAADDGKAARPTQPLNGRTTTTY